MDMNPISNPTRTNNMVEMQAAQAKPAKEDAPLQQKDSVEISGSGNQKSNIPEGVHKKWLVMTYFAADCNLQDFQLKGLNDQEFAGSDKNMHLLAYIDVGEKRPQVKVKDYDEKGNIDVSDWRGAKNFYITRDTNEEIIASPALKFHGIQVDSANPENLKNFIINSVEKFPADHRILILDDHGAGFMGALSDDSSKNKMTLPGIKNAIKEAEETTGKRLDIIGFNACLMAQTEVGYQLKDHADILLASEEVEGGKGWNYKDILNEVSPNRGTGSPDEVASPDKFAKIVVDSNKKIDDEISTFSAIDLKKFDKVKDSINSLATAIINTDDKKGVWHAILATDKFGSVKTPYRDYRDFGHLCKNIISNSSDENVKEAAKGMISTLNDVVMHNEVNPDEHSCATGLSIYMPFTGQTVPEYPEIDFVKDTLWDEAISSITGQFEQMNRGSVKADVNPDLPKTDNINE